MDWTLIFGGKATCEELRDLYERRGVACVAQDGQISEVRFEDGSGKDFRK